MSIAALNSNHRASANEHIAQMIGRARAAQLVYQKFTQGQVDEAVTAAGWAIMQPERNRLLAEMAVRDTGFGVVEDKVVKNYRKTLGLLRDLKGARSVGSSLNIQIKASSRSHVLSELSPRLHHPRVRQPPLPARLLTPSRAAMRSSSHHHQRD